MRFDEEAYAREVLEPARLAGNQPPADLLLRYGLSLPLSPAEIAATLPALLGCWRRVRRELKYRKLVTRLEADHTRLAPAFEKAKAGDVTALQAAIDAASTADDDRWRLLGREIEDIAGPVRRITAELAGDLAVRHGLTSQQVTAHLVQAGIDVVSPDRLPVVPPVSGYRRYREALHTLGCRHTADFVTDGGDAGVAVWDLLSLPDRPELGVDDVHAADRAWAARPHDGSRTLASTVLVGLKSLVNEQGPAGLAELVRYEVAEELRTRHRQGASAAALVEYAVRSLGLVADDARRLAFAVRAEPLGSPVATPPTSAVPTTDTAPHPPHPGPDTAPPIPPAPDPASPWATGPSPPRGAPAAGTPLSATPATPGTPPDGAPVTPGRPPSLPAAWPGTASPAGPTAVPPDPPARPPRHAAQPPGITAQPPRGPVPPPATVGDGAGRPGLPAPPGSDRATPPGGPMSATRPDPAASRPPGHREVEQTAARHPSAPSHAADAATPPATVSSSPPVAAPPDAPAATSWSLVPSDPAAVTTPSTTPVPSPAPVADPAMPRTGPGSAGTSERPLSPLGAYAPLPSPSHIAADRAGDEVVVRWQWPTELTEVVIRWRPQPPGPGRELSHDWREKSISRGAYRSQGGAWLPLVPAAGAPETGRSAREATGGPGSLSGNGDRNAPLEIELVPVAPRHGRRVTGAPVVVRVPGRVEAWYEVTRSGPPWRRELTIAVRTGQYARLRRLMVVLRHGTVMPLHASDGEVLRQLEDVRLAPGEPLRLRMPAPRGPYWLRCFAADGEVDLRDPPVVQLRGR